MSVTTAPGSAAFERTGPGWRHRVESTPIRRLQDLSLAALVVGAVVAVQVWNMTAVPGRRSGEGILVSRAWLLDRAGSRTHVTDWYDHPPLGWLMLTAWTTVTNAFDRASSGIAAGRELMLVATLASAGLVWVLSRRLGLDRWAAAIAVALFGLSPLALELHRLVSLDNLAVPWVLGAFALASHPRRPLVAFAGTGICLALALLTNQTAVVFVPLVVWQLRRSSLPSTRRYGMVLGGSLFGALCGAYLVRALLSGEAGELVTNGWALGGSGSPERWFELDAIGLVLMVLAAPIALATAPRLRPCAAAVLVVVALTWFRGFEPETVIVWLLPFGAVVIAGLAQQLQKQGSVTYLAWFGLFALGAFLVLSWAADQGRLLDEDEDLAWRQAQSWTVDNVQGDWRVIVDDALWVDVVEAGFPVDRVIGYDALNDGEGWRYDDIFLATDAARVSSALRTARENLAILATFGTDDDRIVVGRIVPDGGRSIRQLFGHDPLAAATTGQALVNNPAIRFDTPARNALVAGKVDERLMTTLVALATDRPIRVLDLPVEPAESGSGGPRRTMHLRAEDPEGTRAITALLEAQQAPYRPVDIEVGPDQQVTVRYLPAALTR